MSGTCDKRIGCWCEKSRLVSSKLTLWRQCIETHKLPWVTGVLKPHQIDLPYSTTFLPHSTWKFEDIELLSARLQNTFILLYILATSAWRDADHISYTTGM
jgi:hypothetical protein